MGNRLLPPVVVLLLTVGEFRKTWDLWSSWNEFSGTKNSWRPGILSRERAKVWNLEPAKPRSRECAKVWNLEPAKPGSRERVKVWNLEPSKPWSRERVKSHELRESVKFGNLPKVKFGSHGARRFSEREDSRTSKKQSQRRCLKKFGFSVWTSGKIVNVWDEKDMHVCVHIGNILRARGCFRNVKVPSSPYKRGREGTCKWIHIFGGLSSLWEILSLLLRHLCVWTCSLLSLTCSGILSEFSDTPNINLIWSWDAQVIERKVVGVVSKGGGGSESM
jgi:hypothetical protein